VKRLSVILLALPLPLLSAPNSNATLRVLSLVDCVRQAVEHNFDVKIEEKNVEIARSQLGTAYGEYDPVLRGLVQHDHGLITTTNGPLTAGNTDTDHVEAGVTGRLPTGLEFDLGTAMRDVSGTEDNAPLDATDGAVRLKLRQPLLKNAWIDAPRLHIQVSRKQLKISELGLRGQLMNVITRVELAYYDLLLTREAVKVQEEALRLAEELLAANRARIQQGVMAAQDEKQAESQASAQRSLLLAAQRAVGSQENVLKALLSDRLQDWQDVGIQPTTELQAAPAAVQRSESWERGLSMRPDLLQARADLERLGYIVKFNKNQLFPQLDVTGTYGHAASDREFSGAFDQARRGSNPFYSYGLEMTIPLTRRTARETYRGSRAEQEQAVLRLRQLEQAIMLDIDDAVKVIETDFERVSTTRSAREFAEAALHAEQTRMDNGKGSSFVVLQLQRDLTTARSEQARALTEYNKAQAQLALREGSVFQRHHIVLDP